MKELLYSFITVTGERLIGELVHVDDERKMMHIGYPVKMGLVPMQTPDGMMNSIFPSLYQIFGDSEVVPLRSSFIVSITECSDLDADFYYHVLESLLVQETRRRIVVGRHLFELDYSDKFVFEAPETIQ